MSIKEPFPIKVYRGLTYSDSNFINKYRVGDKFILRSRNLVQSWSSTHCVSEFFASTEKFGIIVSTILDPEDIAIDTRFLDMKQLRNFFWREQREINERLFKSIDKNTSTLEELKSTIEVSRGSLKVIGWLIAITSGILGIIIAFKKLF